MGSIFAFFDSETDAPLFDANRQTGTSKRPAQIPTASALQAVYHELGGVTRLRLCQLWPLSGRARAAALCVAKGAILPGADVKTLICADGVYRAECYDRNRFAGI
jgi:hypothetical protein